MASGLLGLLANRSNQAILALLAVEPAYPRKIGQLLSLSETEVSRRLKRMEDLGLLASEWQHVGKNVKMYHLAVQAAALSITPEGVGVSLGGQPSAPTGRSGGAPRAEIEVPAAEGFVGRAADLARLREGPAVIILEGMPGIGKTSLLARFASESKAPLFWHGFRGVESLRWLANRLAMFHAQQGDGDLLERLGPDTEPADLHDLILSALDRTGRVHIFDDIQNIQDDAVRALVSDAIRRTRKGRLLLSARESPRYDPTLPHVATLRLDGLGDADVAAFIQSKEIAFTPSLLPRLRDEVGGHPLALNLFLEAAKHHDGGVESLLDRIPEREVEEYLLREVYEGLSQDDRLVLATSSLFRAPFTLDQLRALSAKDPERALLRLRRRLLVDVIEGRYVLHEIIRNFFYHLLQDKPRLHEKAARHALSEDTTEGRLEAMFHLLAAGRRARVLELLEDDLDLRDFDFLDDAHHNLYREILDAFDRKEVTDARRWALIEDEKGDIAFHRADYERALKHYAEAVKAFQGAKDGERVADLAWKRALAFTRLGRAKDAQAALAEGLEAAPDGGVSRGRLEALAEELRIEV